MGVREGAGSGQDRRVGGGALFPGFTCTVPPLP